MIRRLLALLAAMMTVLALTACSGLPTSGSVNPGLPQEDVPEAPDFLFQPNSPQPGMTPQQIVQGFVDAATSPEDGLGDRPPIPRARAQRDVEPGGPASRSRRTGCTPRSPTRRSCSP